MVDQNSVFVYLRNDLPPKMHEFVTPCADGYTVYIDAKLDHEHQLRAYNHALKHIENGDYDIDTGISVSDIEMKAHGLVSDPIPGDQFRKDLQKDLIQAKRSCEARLRRISARNKWLEAYGVDMFAVAESQWLDPDWR